MHTVSGGVLQSSIPVTLGPATCVTLLTVQAGTTTVSKTGILCVALRIDNLKFFSRENFRIFLDKINFELTQLIVASSLFAFLQIRIEKRLCCLSSRYKNSKRQNFLTNVQFKAPSCLFAFLQILSRSGYVA